MNVRLEGMQPEVPSQKLASLNVFCFGTKKRGAFCWPGGLLFWGAKQGQTDKQTNGQRARVYEKNAQGVKSSSSSSLALVSDSSRPKLVLRDCASKGP